MQLRKIAHPCFERLGATGVIITSGCAGGGGRGAPEPGIPMQIAEGAFVTVNGADQWVTVRGRDDRNPLLLIVGGPGVALSPMAPFFGPWERSFTLVQWDQPGAGATHAMSLQRTPGPLSIDRLVNDGLAVAESLKTRFPGRKVVLLAVSAGTIAAMRMIMRRPDLFAAYVGTGQVVHWRRQERHAFDLALESARHRADRVAVDDLERIGPPPYSSIDGDALLGRYAAPLTPGEQAHLAAAGPASSSESHGAPDDRSYLAPGLPRPDTRTLAQAAFGALRPEILAFDARSLGTRFEVPIFVLQGEHDIYTPIQDVKRWLEEVDAPVKRIVRIRGGGHASVFMRDEFLAELERHVRPIVVGEPPHLVLVHREVLRPGAGPAYDEIERDAARICLDLSCPHPHLAIRSESDASEVWWLNAFDTDGQHQQVVDAYEQNEPLSRALGTIVARKEGLIETPTATLVEYRPESSAGGAWTLVGARFFVVAEGELDAPRYGAVFAGDDRRRLLLQPVATLESAKAVADALGEGARVFRVCPNWGMPAEEWLRADPEFWAPNPSARRP